ncbi:uncharacterized protein LOC106698879 isoform X1 [Myotis lucifugus]|uniref:uncharacterized protein LOC106698879 isoform X1 n=1 Tax=Myotis lucifugus TaxID=59463 RepID=UPI0006D742B9|nr:uncharacterized protein LOC106698879 isoform X1 [Myotis lucifugus]
MIDSPGDSGLWVAWTPWRWAGGVGGGRRSCRFRQTRSGCAGAWKQLCRSGAVPRRRPAPWCPGAAGSWRRSPEAASLRQGQPAARGHQVRGSLRPVEGAPPSPARDVLQGSLATLPILRISRRWETEKEHSDFGLEPLCDGVRNPLTDGCAAHLCSRPGTPPPSATQPGGPCHFQRDCRSLAPPEPSPHASWWEGGRLCHWDV